MGTVGLMTYDTPACFDSLSIHPESDVTPAVGSGDEHGDEEDEDIDG